MLSARYRWEAELSDGKIIREGGDLAGAVRFSLVPSVPGLPRHDVVGLSLVRRFGRAFQRVVGLKPNEYVHCVVAEGLRLYVRCSDGAALVTPSDYELYL